MSNLKPILVTGSHRSGTTWLANMLGFAPGTLLLYEPFSLNESRYKLNGLAKYWFAYAPGLPIGPSLEAYRKVLNGGTGKVFRRRQIQRYLPFRRRARFIIKDPIACLSSDWLYKNFELEVIVLIRHPAAFAASLKRMNWFFSFQNFLKQPQLMEDLLSQYRHEIQSHHEGIIEQAALLWKVIYHVLLEYSKNHEDWNVTTHEKLSAHPASTINEIYQGFGLEWTTSIEKRIKAFTGAHNPIVPRKQTIHALRRNSLANIDRWRQILTQREIEKIHKITYPIAHKIYGADYW